MKKNLIIVIASLLVLLVIVFVVLLIPEIQEEGREPVGDVVEDDIENPITFTIMMGGDLEPPEERPILEEMARRTGVSFDVRVTGGQTEEILSIMLASRDFTDIVMVPRDHMLGRFKESGNIIDLRQLLRDNAPTVYELFTIDENGNLLDRFATDDGKIYYLTDDLELLREGEMPPPDWRLDDPNRFQEELPWHRVLYVLYPDIYEVAPGPIRNLDQFYDALVKFRQLYPDRYPITMSSTSGEHIVWAALSMYGYKVLSHGIGGAAYATIDGDNYIFSFRTPELLEFFKFMNKLYREGLMDPDGPVQPDERMLEKMNNAEVFSMIGFWDPIHETDGHFDTMGIEKRFIPQKLVAQGVDKVWQYNYAYVGNNALMVSTECDDPARLMRFFEWLYSDEGLILNGWGIEGEDHIVNEQGLRDVTAEIDEAWTVDPYLGFERGLNSFYGVINLPSFTSDGQPAFYWNAPFYQIEEGIEPIVLRIRESVFNWHRDWGSTFWRDFTEVDVFIPAGTTESIAFTQSYAMINDAVSRMVMAGSEEEVERIYIEILEQMEAAGIDKWENYINNVIDERRGN